MGDHTETRKVTFDDGEVREYPIEERRVDEHCKDNGHNWEYLYSTYECSACKQVVEE